MCTLECARQNSETIVAFASNIGGLALIVEGFSTEADVRVHCSLLLRKDLWP